MVPHTLAAWFPSRRRAVFAVPVAFALAALSCSGVPLTAPSGTAITLLASSTTLSPNGSTDITAVLIEGAQGAPDDNGQFEPINGVGTPVHDGTHVTFMTSLGRLEPSEATTKNGRATVKLFGDGRSGTATITAFSGGSSRSLDVTIGVGAEGRVILTATPQTLPATGGSATIQARVEDAAGNGLASVGVTFQTTAGSLSSSTATTNGDGLATVTLTSTTAAQVTATAGGQTATLDVALGALTSISITPPSTIHVSTPATFTIGISSTGDNATLTDAVISFGDGDSAPLGTLIEGSNQTVIHLYGGAGVETVTVTGKDPNGVTVSRSTQVAVGQLSATGSAVASGSGNTATFTVTVTPAGALIDRFVWDFGDGTGVTTPSSQINHVYGTSGTKNVKVTIVPVAGAPIEVFIQVNVVG